VLCYDFGGQGDFLTDGETGYLVALNDRERFLEKWRDLCSDPATRKRMGAVNLERVEEYFIEHCAARYENLFEEILAERSPVSSRR